MAEVIEIFNEFKTKVEKDQFVKKQHETITVLFEKNRHLEAEVAHLKQLLLSMQEPKVEKIILSPEEALVESQIELIQQRSYNVEMTLEDVKKLDILIKNKRLSKEQNTVIQGESKKIDQKNYSNAELLKIASIKNET